MDRHAVTDHGPGGVDPIGTLRRWLMFNAVGGMGIGVQLLTLGALADGLGLDYRLGTALAVLAAVLHNFVWHEHWTWGDRCAGRRGRWARLGSFTLVNGTLSIAGNVLFTSLYVTAFGHPPRAGQPAGHRDLLGRQFPGQPPTSSSGRPQSRRRWQPRSPRATWRGLGAAELKDKTVAAWERYVAATERRIAGELDDAEGFLALDFVRGAAEARRKVLAGDVVVERMEARDAAGRKIKVPSGAVHHWRGSILIPGITLDELLHGLMHAVPPEEIQKDVLESRLIASDGDRREVFLKVPPRVRGDGPLQHGTSGGVQPPRSRAGVEPQRIHADCGAGGRRVAGGAREADRPRPRVPVAPERLLALPGGGRRGHRGVRVGQSEPRRAARAQLDDPARASTARRAPRCPTR